MLVTGTPTQAYVDALKAALAADATLMSLVTGIYGHLPDAARTAYPYQALGQRNRQSDVGVMGMLCSLVTVEVNVWSAHRGASEVQAILARNVIVLERKTLRVSGFTMVEGSLTCEFEDVFDEPDEDQPSRRLYRGIQRWRAEIHES